MTRDDDKVKALAKAIAGAEGFYVPNSFSARNHNPGDIVDFHTGIKRIFLSDDAGWDALYHQVYIMLVGRSHMYNLNMTFEQVANVYTGNDDPGSWCHNVIYGLKGMGYDVNNQTTLKDFANL